MTMLIYEYGSLMYNLVYNELYYHICRTHHAYIMYRTYYTWNLLKFENWSFWNVFKTVIV